MKDWQVGYRGVMLARLGPEHRTPENLAANIKRLRERKGHTQQELAELSGVPRPTIANLESGSANPTLAVLLKVADSLGATIEELVASAGAGGVVHRARTLPERRKGGAMIRRLIPDGFRPAEFERVELAPGAKLGVRAEGAGVREVLACEAGEIEVIASGERLMLGIGDVAAFGADQPRDYANRGRRKAVAYRLLATATPAPPD
jgi:transcriptional regulator with XRE-family HTH domain